MSFQGGESTVLGGLTVLEIASGNISASFAGKLMAGFGANVIKVEPYEGDPIRRWQSSELENGNQSPFFCYLNSLKRSIGLRDCQRGQQLVRRLLERARILLLGFETGRAEYGLAPDVIRTEYPELIALTFSPFGAEGPYAKYASSDLVVTQLSGVGYNNPGQAPTANHPPLRFDGYLPDMFAGLVGAVAALTGLHEKDSGGNCSWHDISVQQVLLATMADPLAYYSLAGVDSPRIGSSFYISGAVYDSIRCRDGYFYLTLLSDEPFARWIEIMGRPEWATDGLLSSRQAWGANWDAVKPLIESWAQHYSKEEICQMAQARRIPVAPLNTPLDVTNSPHLRDRGFFQTWEQPGLGHVRMPGLPVRAPGINEAGPAPRLGEHTGEILSELNCTPDEVRLLTRMGYVTPASSVAPALSPPPGPRELSSRPSPRSYITQDVSATDEITDLPLRGVRVVDLTMALAGPYCTSLLGMLGAEVIKVESSIRPDLYRENSFRVPARPELIGCREVAPSFVAANLSKLGCTINLKHPEGFQLFKQLVAISDVVVENLSKRAINRLGISYEHLKELRSDLIMVSISGFGRTGPMSDFVAFGFPVQSYAGQFWTGGYPGERLAGHDMAALADIAAALTGTFGILLGMEWKKQTGTGQYLDVSMIEAMLSVFALPVLESLFTGPRKAEGNQLRGVAPYGCYPCAGEDEWVAITVQTDAQWISLCELMARPDLQISEYEDQYSRWKARDRLDVELSSWTQQFSKHEITQRLQQLGIPAGPSLRMSEILQDEQLDYRHAFTNLLEPSLGLARGLGLPWKLDPSRVRTTPSPNLGQDNSYVFTELLGIPEAELIRLRDLGAIS